MNNTNSYPEIIECDLFDTEYKIIMHQVNCQGKMSSGVAKQVRERYPECYEGYKLRLKEYGAFYLFGKCVICYDVDKVIMNVFGQYTYGYDGKQYTDYDALKHGIIDGVSNFRQEMKDKSTLDIAIPYKMGCHLGGGDWNVVYEILRCLQSNLNVRFHCYKLNKER